MKRILCLLFFLFAISPPSFQRGGFAQNADPVLANNSKATASAQDSAVEEFSNTEESEQNADPQVLIEELVGPLDTDSIDAETIAATSGWIHASGLTELLGPLTPLALSPFFGVNVYVSPFFWKSVFVFGVNVCIALFFGRVIVFLSECMCIALF